MEFPTLLKKLVSPNEDKKEEITENIKEEIPVITTTVETEQTK